MQPKPHTQPYPWLLCALLLLGVALALVQPVQAANYSQRQVARWQADTTPPSVTINQADGQADPSTRNAAGLFQAVFIARFSEPITGFDTYDLNFWEPNRFYGFTISISGGPSEYTITIVSQGLIAGNDETVNISLPAGVVTDLAGNPNSASTSADNSVTILRPTPLPTLVAAALPPGIPGAPPGAPAPVGTPCASASCGGTLPPPGGGVGVPVPGPSLTPMPELFIYRAPGKANPARSNPVFFIANFSRPAPNFTGQELLYATGAARYDYRSPQISGGPRVYTLTVDGLVGQGYVSFLLSDNLNTLSFILRDTNDDMIAYDMTSSVVSAAAHPEAGQVVSPSNNVDTALAFSSTVNPAPVADVAPAPGAPANQSIFLPIVSKLAGTAFGDNSGFLGIVLVVLLVGGLFVIRRIRR